MPVFFSQIRFSHDFTPPHRMLHEHARGVGQSVAAVHMGLPLFLVVAFVQGTFQRERESEGRVKGRERVIC